MIILDATLCVFRLATEGVQSLLASSWQSRSQRVGGHTWGWVSLSDILLLVEVKYDVVSHLLYTEMLQEHHGEDTLPLTGQLSVFVLSIFPFTSFVHSTQSLGDPAAMATPDGS